MSMNELRGRVLNDTMNLALHTKNLNDGLVALTKWVGNYVALKTHILIHHSLTDDGQTLSWPAIRDFHINTNGWDDIGYAFGVEKFKAGVEILMGRMILEKGAHCPERNMNEKSIGICIVGNFDLAPPPPEIWEASAKLVSSLSVYGGIPVEQVKGHREFNDHKSCPGKLFNMDLFRQEVKLKCNQFKH